MTPAPTTTEPDADARAPRPAPRVLAYGELLIDLILTPNGFTWHLGGAPANAAIAAARLGADAGLVASVGDDFFGEFAVSRLREFGVDCSGVAVVGREQTSLAFIFLDAGGQQSGFSFYRHADVLIGRPQLGAAGVGRGGVFCFGSLSLTGGPVRDSLEEALGRCTEGGVTVVFDINMRPSLWESTEAWAAAVGGVLPRCQVVKASESEARLLSGRSDPSDAAEHLWGDGRKLLLITLGADGCYYKSRRGQGLVPGFDVDASAGDAVGAGDAFVGALCCGIATEGERAFSEQPATVDILRRANAAGAITAAAKGAIAPGLTHAAVEALTRGS